MVNLTLKKLHASTAEKKHERILINYIDFSTIFKLFRSEFWKRVSTLAKIIIKKKTLLLRTLVIFIIA